MKKNLVFQRLSAILLPGILLLTACAAPTATPVPPLPPTAAPAAATKAPASAAPATAAGAPAFKISGKVAAEKSWTEDEIKAMKTSEVQSTDSSGQPAKYTGVLLNTLLDAAKPAADAATLIFVASDGFKVEMPYKEAKACEQCLVSFRTQGGYSLVMPNLAKNLQVKGVVEVQVK